MMSTGRRSRGCGWKIQRRRWATRQVGLPNYERIRTPAAMEEYMKVIGIIAEYNPFHNGHAYQLAKVREQTGADYIAVAMSGDFVQRGEPAIIDKYARTEMALQNGADLVIELPVLWASSSAEAFAMAGVTLFEKMSCVDGICFGAETDNLPLLTAVADILADEPEDYRRLLSSCLRKGMSFPSARAQALCEIFEAVPAANQSALKNDCSEAAALPGAENSVSEAAANLSAILTSPNNILAIEYLKALKRLNSPMKPILLKRVGAGYHDTNINHSENLCKKEKETVPTASATAIRNILFSENAAFSAKPDMAEKLPDGFFSTVSASAPLSEALKPIMPDCPLLPEALESAMPVSALHILADYLKSSPVINAQDFSPLLGYQLLTQDKDSLSRIGGTTPELANRLYNNRCQYFSFSQFCELNKSREVTYTRISRILLHLVLQITEDACALGRSLDYIPYLRILGFRKSSSALLSVLKSSAGVPMLSKLADASSLLSPEAEQLLEKDIFAADLYEQTKAIKSHAPSRSEYSREIVRI